MKVFGEPWGVGEGGAGLVWGHPGTPPQSSSHSEAPQGRTELSGLLEGRFIVEGEGEGGWHRPVGGSGGKRPRGVGSHRPGSSLPAAQNVTVDEVLGAYKQACQKLSCRQIPKLLRQLQVMPRAGGVAGTLPPPPSPLRAREGVQSTPPAPSLVGQPGDCKSNRTLPECLSSTELCEVGSYLSRIFHSPKQFSSPGEKPRIPNLKV